MSDLSIQATSSVDFYTLRKVLSSSTLTDGEKVNYIKKNSSEIRALMKGVLTPEEYDLIMCNRPLLRNKPIKNAYMKKGDKVLLAEAIGIPQNEIELYIDNTVDKIKNPSNAHDLTDKKVSAVKTYVYRHGKKDQVLAFLNYDLSHTINLEKTIHKTLSYKTGGVADYFSRPIHRMDNKTMINIFNIIDEHILDAQKKGLITTAQTLDLAQWVFGRVYLLQNNSKFFKKTF